jgi:hypothetical protein
MTNRTEIRTERNIFATNATASNVVSLEVPSKSLLTELRSSASVFPHTEPLQQLSEAKFVLTNDGPRSHVGKDS